MFLCADWLPDPGSFEPGSETGRVAEEMRKMLEEAEPPADSLMSFGDTASATHAVQTSSKALQELGIRIGDKVVVGGMKVNLILVYYMFYPLKN